MKDMLYAGGGLISVIIAAYFMWSYIKQPAGAAVSNMPFIIAVIFGLLALVCGVMFLTGRVNKQEEIHITE